jgi:ATP-dependent DNA helicase RecQ
VAHAASALLESLALIHGVSTTPRVLAAAPAKGVPHLHFFGTPDPAAWTLIEAGDAAVIAPRPVAPRYLEPLLRAAPRPVLAPSPDRAEVVTEGLTYLLRNVFRKKWFRPGQVEIVRRALALKPVVGLLPTGAGKSLCFQLASLLQPGFTLVVDPLRSLMLDQQENLLALGIHRCRAILGSLEATAAKDTAELDEAYRAIASGHYLFVFVAPERLQMPTFRQHVQTFAAAVPIPYCVVDEAHCVSEWGHDFRPAYLNIGRLVCDYCRFDEREPCVVALTGTASRNVLTDILRELVIDDQDAIIEPKSFDRKELTFEVHQVKATDRLPQVVGRLRALLTEAGWQPGQPGELPSGLVFTNFATAGYVGVEAIAAELTRHLGFNPGIYSGKKPYGFQGTKVDWEREKLHIQRRFKLNECPILVCTQSFGMGIDKPDIRFTIHAILPRSLEDFYQQAGRAGRDGEEARCLLFFSDDQPGLADELLDTERTQLESIARRANVVSRRGQGDAIRNTWFLTQSFIGRDV